MEENDMYLNIGSRREVFWDDYLIDPAQTTAKLTMYRPEKKEILYDAKTLWQIRSVSYPHYIELDGQCMMYYISGIRCIHTHPNGSPILSDVDLHSLKSMKFLTLRRSNI